MSLNIYFCSLQIIWVNYLFVILADTRQIFHNTLKRSQSYKTGTSTHAKWLFKTSEFTQLFNATFVQFNMGDQDTPLWGQRWYQDVRRLWEYGLRSETSMIQAIKTVFEMRAISRSMEPSPLDEVCVHFILFVK